MYLPRGVRIILDQHLRSPLDIMRLRGCMQLLVFRQHLTGGDMPIVGVGGGGGGSGICLSAAHLIRVSEHRDCSLEDGGGTLIGYSGQISQQQSRHTILGGALCEPEIPSGAPVRWSCAALAVISEPASRTHGVMASNT